MTRRTDHLDRKLNASSLSLVRQVRPRPMEERYAALCADLLREKGPAVEGAYQGNVDALRHRAGGVREESFSAAHRPGGVK